MMDRPVFRPAVVGERGSEDPRLRPAGDRRLNTQNSELNTQNYWGPSPVPSTLLIGFGNVLRGDDGVGVRVAERLRGEDLGHDVRIVAAHQLLPEHVDLLRDAGRAVFVDAAADVPPGEIVAGVLVPADGAAVTFHHLTPAVLLAACAALHGHAPEAVFVRIGVACTDTSTDLSAALAARFEDYCEVVSDWLTR